RPSALSYLSGRNGSPCNPARLSVRALITLVHQAAVREMASRASRSSWSPKIPHEYALVSDNLPIGVGAGRLGQALAILRAAATAAEVAFACHASSCLLIAPIA